MTEPTLVEANFLVIEDPIYNYVEVTDAAPGAKGDQGEASTVPGPTGPIGQTGPQGPMGDPGKVSYTHDQVSPSDLWVIEHGLLYCPNVSVIDSSGAVVVGDVSYVDANTIEVRFTAAFGGKAYLS